MSAGYEGWQEGFVEGEERHRRAGPGGEGAAKDVGWLDVGLGGVRRKGGGGVVTELGKADGAGEGDHKQWTGGRDGITETKATEAVWELGDMGGGLG